MQIEAYLNRKNAKESGKISFREVQVHMHMFILHRYLGMLMLLSRWR